MKSKDNITEMIDYLRSTDNGNPLFDEDRIIAAYQKQGVPQTLPVKMMAIFGGLLTSLAFSGFLVITGIYQSVYGLLGFGVTCIIAAIWINNKYNKVILDTLSISSFIIGLILLWFGLDQLGVHENLRYLIYSILSLCSLLSTRGYILNFAAIFIMNGSILALILSTRSYSLMQIYVSSLTVLLYFFLRQEAGIIHMKKTFSAQYTPIRAGLVFSFLSGLVYLGKRGLIPLSMGYTWVTSMLIITAIAFLMSTLLPILKIKRTMHKVCAYTLTIVILLPTVSSPAISGAVLLMLLSFLVNFRTGFVISIIALVYFISQYYYDLNLTLLTKSVLLASSGIGFLLIYFFFLKNIDSK